MDVKSLLAAACTLFTLRQHSTTTETQPWSSGFFSREQTSLRRLDGYGGARGLASHKICKAACESALQRHLHDWTRGANAAARQPRRVSRLRAARPRDTAARDRGRVNQSTAPVPRPAPPDAAEEAPPRGRLARVGVAPEAAPRAHSRRKRRWAPARPRPPGPANTRWMTC